MSTKTTGRLQLEKYFDVVKKGPIFTTPSLWPLTSSPIFDLISVSIFSVDGTFAM